MTERRRPLENDDGQGALFGGEAFAPAGPTPAWKRPGDSPSRAPVPRSAPPSEAGVDLDAPAASNPPRADDAADAAAHTIGPHASEPGAEDAPRASAHPDADVVDPRGFEPGPGDDSLVRGAAAPATPSPFADEIAALERATERHSPRRPEAPLAGPTLDDVMSRVWEGLVTGLPAACPVCHGEVVPALSGPPQGRCASCGTTID